ncbi:uncharacterized protein VTP21DRAFT_4954 [Calcarisporiella thermophila]|uniref:uncharacterized protein n=1 Tax=Calcarisporiella thermophila TaxID=911321 RepID=UPI0037427C4B
MARQGNRILIVGGGCFGLSTALALSGDPSLHITVFDRAQIPSRDAASNDTTKLVRMDYGNDVLYQDLTIEALPIWRKWNSEARRRYGQDVFTESGILFLSRDHLGEYEKRSMANLSQVLPEALKTLSHQDVQREYPQFHRHWNIGYLNKQDGWCFAELAIRLVADICLERKVKFIVGKAGEFKSFVWRNGRVCGIMTQDGGQYYGDKIIMAIGSWTGSLLPGMNNIITATGHPVMHFKIPEQLRGRYLSDVFPAWEADTPNTGFYGFPSKPDGDLKIAIHSPGYINTISTNSNGVVSVPRTIVDHPNDTIPHEILTKTRAFLRNCLPEIADLEITKAKLCWYCDTFDGNFIADYHPSLPGVFVLAGDSGHGMKFLPVIGEKVRGIIEKDATLLKRYSAWSWREPQVGKAIVFDAMRSNQNGDDRKELRDSRMARSEELFRHQTARL